MVGGKRPPNMFFGTIWTCRSILTKMPPFLKVPYSIYFRMSTYFIYMRIDMYIYIYVEYIYMQNIYIQNTYIEYIYRIIEYIYRIYIQNIYIYYAVKKTDSVSSRSLPLNQWHMMYWRIANNREPALSVFLTIYICIYIYIYITFNSSYFCRI